MEERVRELEIGNATLAANVGHLSAEVKNLAAVVQDLRDTMNKGRGALWLAMAAAGSIGAVAATFAKKLLGLV